MSLIHLGPVLASGEVLTLLSRDGRLAADELDKRARSRGRAARASPDEHDGKMDGGVQASHLECGSLQGGERAREDRRGEALCRERAQEKGVAALEGEAEWLTAGGEALVQDGGDGRATTGRDDRVLAQVGDADVWSGWAAVGSEDGDHLLLAQSLDGEVVADLAVEEAEGGVQLVGGKEAQHVGGDALAQADLDAGVRLAEAG